MPRVYIIIVNWNGWRDTIECLESVFRLTYEDFRVIVCDNGSSDGSLGRIAGWAKGEVRAGCANPQLLHLTSPPCPKPIPSVRLEPGDELPSAGSSERLFLLSTGANLGFAGGNNAAIRLALASGHVDYVWLLNNDTVVDEQALSRLVERCEQRAGVGMCGSTLRYYYQPQRIQAQGGCAYNAWTARMREIGLGADASSTLDAALVESRIHYVSGASMLVRRALLESVGLMNEEYFLYFEEIDWATRARGTFGLAYAPGSLVFHKDGGSTGTQGGVGNTNGAQRRTASPLSEFYTARNRILFTFRHHRIALPAVMAALAASGLQRLLRGRWRNFMALLRGWGAGVCLISRHPPASNSGHAGSPRKEDR